MRVSTYRDLESKEGLLPLLDLAFRWPFNPRRFESFVKMDPRLRNSPVGFCALEGGMVVGYVGVMDLATRTLTGDVEHVGGIYGVSTLPSHARSGISTLLMKKAHKHFASMGYRFSFLGTSRTIIAHSFYEKLGYADLFDRPSAYLVLRGKRDKSASKAKAVRLDPDNVFRIYGEYVKGKTGFVVRDKDHFKMLKRDQGLTGKQCIIGEEGYLLFRRDNGGVWIKEVVALSRNEMDRLVAVVEQMARDVVYDRAVLDRNLLEVYRARGYAVQGRSHDVMMVKPLTSHMTFKQTYGDKFSLTGLDFF